MDIQRGYIIKGGSLEAIMNAKTQIFRHLGVFAKGPKLFSIAEYSNEQPETPAVVELFHTGEKDPSYNFKVAADLVTNLGVKDPFSLQFFLKCPPLLLSKTPYVTIDLALDK